MPLLSLERAERLSCVKTPSGRLQSASASLLLESQLKKHYGLAAEQLTYAKSDRGKPYLKRQSPSGELSFSISHCDEWAACAIIFSGEASSGPVQIGVDIERIGRGKNNIVEGRFCDEEIRAMRQFEKMGEEKWQRAFTALWTAKEAVAKCLDWPLMEVLGEMNLASLLTHEQSSIMSEGSRQKRQTSINPIEFATPQGQRIYVGGMDVDSHFIHAASTLPEILTLHYIDK